MRHEHRQMFADANLRVRSCGPEFAAGKTVSRLLFRDQIPEGALKHFAFNDRDIDDAVYTEFTDGTGLLLASGHDGPASQDTPDVFYRVYLYSVTPVSIAPKQDTP